MVVNNSKQTGIVTLQIGITNIQSCHQTKFRRRIGSSWLVSGATEEERFWMDIGSTRSMVDQCGSVKTMAKYGVSAYLWWWKW